MFTIESVRSFMNQQPCPAPPDEAEEIFPALDSLDESGDTTLDIIEASMVLDVWVIRFEIWVA